MRLVERPRLAEFVRPEEPFCCSWDSAALLQHGPPGYGAVYRNSRQEYTTDSLGVANLRGGARGLGSSPCREESPTFRR